MTSKEIAERIVFLADNGEGLHPIAEGEKLIKQHVTKFVKDNLDHWRTFETSEDVTAFLAEIYDEWNSPK